MRPAKEDSGLRVASRSMTVHAVAVRRREGRRTGRRVTLCGRTIDHNYNVQRASTAVSCGQCVAILEEVAR